RSGLPRVQRRGAISPLRGTALLQEGVFELGFPGAAGGIVDAEMRGEIPVSPSKAACFDRLANEARVTLARGIVRFVVRAELSNPNGPSVPARPALDGVEPMFDLMALVIAAARRVHPCIRSLDPRRALVGELVRLV